MQQSRNNKENNTDSPQQQRTATHEIDRHTPPEHPRTQQRNPPISEEWHALEQTLEYVEVNHPGIITQWKNKHQLDTSTASGHQTNNRPKKGTPSKHKSSKAKNAHTEETYQGNRPTNTRQEPEDADGEGPPHNNKNTPTHNTQDNMGEDGPTPNQRNRPIDPVPYFEEEQEQDKDEEGTDKDVDSGT